MAKKVSRNQPFNHISVLTFSRLKNIKASRALIEELPAPGVPSLPSTNKFHAPQVPRGKLNFSLECVSRGVGGWGVAGGWGEGGAGLLRAPSGQVYRVASQSNNSPSSTSAASTSEITPPATGVTTTTTTSTDIPSESIRTFDPNDQNKLGAIHPGSLAVVAAFNSRRCSGFPLYGQVRDTVVQMDHRFCF